MSGCGNCGSKCPLQNIGTIVDMMGGGDEIPGNKELKEAGINPCNNCLEGVKIEVKKLTTKE